MLFPLNILPQPTEQGKKIELRELRDQLKKKWGPDMTELKPPGVETKT